MIFRGMLATIRSRRVHIQLGDRDGGDIAGKCGNVAYGLLRGYNQPGWPPEDARYDTPGWFFDDDRANLTATPPSLPVIRFTTFACTKT